MVLNKAALGIVCEVDCGQSEYKTYLICTTSVEHRNNTVRPGKNLTNGSYLCLDWYFAERSQHQPPYSLHRTQVFSPEN